MSIHHIKKNKQELGNNLSIIILATPSPTSNKGLGIKSLIDVCGDKLINRQISLLKSKYETPEILYVTTEDCLKVYPYLPKSVTYITTPTNEEKSVINTLSHGVRASTKENLLILYGDLIFNKECFDFNHSQSCVIFETTEADKYKIGCNINKGRLEYMMYNLPNRWTEILYFTKPLIRPIEQYIHNHDTHTKMMSELVNFLIYKDLPIMAEYPNNSKCFYNDFAKYILLAEEIFNK